MIQTLIFLKLPSAHGVLSGRNVKQCISRNSFYTKEQNKVDPSSLYMKETSSHYQVFFKISDLKYFAIFIGKHLYQSLILRKLQVWRHSFSYRSPLVAVSEREAEIGW